MLRVYIIGILFFIALVATQCAFLHFSNNNDPSLAKITRPASDTMTKQMLRNHGTDNSYDIP